MIPWYIICFAAVLIYFLTGAMIGTWLYKDAVARGDKNAGAWIFFGILINFVAAILYLNDRRDAPEPVARHPYPPPPPPAYQPPGGPFPQRPPVQGHPGQYPPPPGQYPPPPAPAPSPQTPSAERVTDVKEPAAPREYPPLE